MRASHGHHHEHHEHSGGSTNLVLDIGGNVGALLIYTGPELDQAEIEISPGQDPGAPRSHNQVHARANGSRVGYTAVFPSVPAGEYTIWHLDGTAKASVTIHGGQVTEHHWDWGTARTHHASGPRPFPRHQRVSD